jgi:GT2 family glycosyltransferase
MNPIAILILTYNQRDRTLQCLAQLYEVADAANCHVLVWDNGSSDGTGQAVRATFPNVLMHESPTNLGVASGRNAAAALATETWQPGYFLFLDNDMLVEPGFVDALHAPFVGNGRVGQTQAKLRFMDTPERLNDGGGARISFVFWRSIPVGFDEVDEGQYDAIKPCIACGGAMMVRRDLFQQLGGFDPIFDPFGPEDADFSLRLQKAGYQALYAPQAMAFHQVSHTFGKGYSEEYARHKSRHWRTFMGRHATPLQKTGFYTIGAPYLAGKVFLREAKRGNLGAIRGLLKGIFDKHTAE